MQEYEAGRKLAGDNPKHINKTKTKLERFKKKKKIEE